MRTLYVFYKSFNKEKVAIDLSTRTYYYIARKVTSSIDSNKVKKNNINILHNKSILIIIIHINTTRPMIPIENIKFSTFLPCVILEKNNTCIILLDNYSNCNTYYNYNVIYITDLRKTHNDKNNKE